MAATYISAQNDVVDAIANQYYGAVTSDILNMVLQVNHGLSRIGPVLPAGVQILLPDLPPAPNANVVVKLWD